MQLELTKEQVKKFKAALDELSNSMTRVEAERDFIKETKKILRKELNLPVKLLNRIAKTYHKKTYDEDVMTDKEFAELYDTWVNTSENAQSR